MRLISYFLHTFGCQMNTADSEKIMSVFLQLGIKRALKIEDADIVILNTCSVRKKGEDKVFSVIQKIFKMNKKGSKKVFIGLTGCMVRKTGINQKYYSKKIKRDATKNITYLKSENSIFNSDDKLFGKTNKIDFVFRIEELNLISKILSIILNTKIGDDTKINDYLKIKQLQENPASANVIIQTGCDNYCTYCIVPFTRGKELSRKKEEILSEIKQVVKSGAKEIVLIGQNVNSYGKENKKKLWNEQELVWNSKDIKTPFSELLHEINKIKGIDRIRFTSSNPHDMTKDILDAHFDLNKTCNYLHFALQSGDNEILKKMNRKHTYEDFKKIVKYLRSQDPLFAISTDIIVGFPGETEVQFQNTVKAFEELDFDFAYIARYSPRPGTFSFKNFEDNITTKEKARRWSILNDLLKKSVQKRAKLMIGREEKILINSKLAKGLVGRTRNFKEVFIDNNDKIKFGDIVKVKIVELDEWVLKGTYI